MAEVDLGVAFIPVVYDADGQPNPTPDTTPVEINGFDLDLDEMGSVLSATKRKKLVQQVMRAIVNEPNRQYLTKVDAAGFRPQVRESIEAFQSVQYNFMLENDPETLGWDVYRVNQATQVLEKITQEPAVDVFEDYPLPTGQVQGYGLVRVSRNGGPSLLTERFLATPVLDGRWMIQENCAVKPERRGLTFYFAQNRKFSAEEILKLVEDVQVAEMTDPRGIAVGFRVHDLLGHKLGEVAKILTTPYKLTSYLEDLKAERSPFWP